jgi:putative inorganic carbon (hco3(-)) transporter
MSSLPLERQQMTRLSSIVLALILSAAAAAGLLLWSNPFAPLLLVGGACATAISLLLLQQPLQALYVALFIRLSAIAFPPPFGIVYTVVVNMAVALALGAWLIRTAGERRPILWNPVTGLIALYIIWSSVTLLWASDLDAGATKLVQYISGLVLVLLITNQVRSPKSLDGIMHVLGLTGWIMIICGLYAALFTDFRFGERLRVLYPCSEASGWLCAPNNENNFGSVLILMIAGAIWPVLRSSGPKRRLHMTLSVVMVLCSIVLVLLTGSRASALALLIVLMAFCFWQPMRPWGIVGLVLFAGLLATAPFLLDTLSNRFAEQEEGELGGRSILWRASLLLLRDVPWTGVGIGNGPLELHAYISALTSYYDYRFDLPSHNPFLEAGIETGLFGMFLYASICVCAMWQFLDRRSRSRMRDRALAGYFPLMLGVATGYLATWIKTGGVENHPTFFVLMALLLIPSHFPQEPDFKSPPRAAGGPPAQPRSPDTPIAKKHDEAS